MAHTEVFILNYNGAHFLPDCLKSLCEAERGDHTMEVVVVDNGSRDDSPALVAKFPGVHYIALNHNHGFSRGNNLGVWARLKQLRRAGRKADFVCFLNNDTAVEREWLIAAMARFECDARIGVVGAKACFWDQFVEISLNAHALEHATASGATNTSNPVQIYLNGATSFSNLHPDPRRTKWISLGPRENDGGRWVPPTGGRILVPAHSSTAPMIVRLVLENRAHPSGMVQATCTVGDQQPELVTLKPGEVREIAFEVLPTEYRAKIQNAGSFVTPDWQGGDEGSFSDDSTSFTEPREVPSVCGVSMFMRAELFSRLHGFYEGMFAYYEDTDLSLRARLAGYTCWYEPRSRLRHIHCGSGGENSPYFNVNVANSHLLFASRWMTSAEFYPKLRAVMRAARAEFREFECDGDLVPKPNLRTIGRCLRHPLRLLLNRCWNWRNRQGIEHLITQHRPRISCV